MAKRVKKQENGKPWWIVMVRDPQWWVPVTVLAGGLMVLLWVR
jgi:hypothetical protein